MNLKVAPELEKIVAAAQEANIAIQDIQFVRNTDIDVLEALSILVEGTDDSKNYFSWLLERGDLIAESLI